MCELCNIQDETGLSDETILRIVKVVEEAEKAHLEHTVLSILYVLDTPNLKITQEAAARAAEDLDYQGVKVTENIADDWSSMTYTVERAKAEKKVQEEKLKPLAPGEVSDDNELAKFFKQMGLEF